MLLCFVILCQTFARLTACNIIHQFIHSLIVICKALYVENVESEAVEAVVRWSVVGKMASF